MPVDHQLVRRRLLRHVVFPQPRLWLEHGRRARTSLGAQQGAQDSCEQRAAAEQPHRAHGPSIRLELPWRSAVILQLTLGSREGIKWLEAAKHPGTRTGQSPLEPKGLTRGKAPVKRRAMCAIAAAVRAGASGVDVGGGGADFPLDVTLTKLPPSFHFVSRAGYAAGRSYPNCGIPSCALDGRKPSAGLLQPPARQHPVRGRPSLWGLL